MLFFIGSWMVIEGLFVLLLPRLATRICVWLLNPGNAAPSEPPAANGADTDHAPKANGNADRDEDQGRNLAELMKEGAKEGDRRDRNRPFYFVLMLANGYLLWALGGTGFFNIPSVSGTTFIQFVLLVPVFVLSALFCLTSASSRAAMAGMISAYKPGQMRTLGLSEASTGAALLVVIWMFQ